MVAVSLAPCADETMDLVNQATQAGVKVIAITSSRMSRLAQNAVTALVVQESEVFGFRALSNTRALVRCLFAPLACRTELKYPTNESRARRHAPSHAPPVRCPQAAPFERQRRLVPTFFPPHNLSQHS